MAEDLIGYGKLVEAALRNVVRAALEKVEAEGLPGEHHLYITFRTDYPGVEIGEALRARYPTEMTIVLQHQYWGLEVDDDQFGVTLSFGGLPQRLLVPFAAVKVFADPGVEFGLQFSVEGAGETGTVVPVPLDDADAGGDAQPEGAREGDEAGGEVVPLDRFRKK